MPSGTMCTSSPMLARPTLVAPLMRSCLPARGTRSARHLVVAQGSGGEAPKGEGEGRGSVESLFQKELARRGMPNDDPSASSSGEGPGPGRQAPPSWGPDVDTPPQLQRSRELNSEGLEGLIPRASALIQLGLGFFLAFGPFILAVVLATCAIYAVFGENFIHGSRPDSGPPPYIDPELLLNEPTVDPMVPMRVE